VISELTDRVVADVTEALSAWSHAEEVAGRDVGPAEEQLERERLLIGALEGQRRQRLAAGRPPLDAGEEAAVAADARARLCGFGALEHLLADPSIENIHANGCDRVFVTYAGGERSAGPALAVTDAELVELVRRIAAHGGRTERRFDDAKPLLALRLPDGSRLSAVMNVSGRPSLSVRRHRHTDVRLADLAALGTLDDSLVAVLRAAVARPHPLNIIVAGGTDAGKTTLLRALLAEIDPAERWSCSSSAMRTATRTSSSSRRAKPTSKARARSRCETSPAMPCAWPPTASSSARSAVEKCSRCSWQ
jgi:hypothetical protein